VPKVLIAGESWTVHSIHQKGFDSFTTTEYAEGVRWLKAALEGAGYEVVFQPSHVAARDFPATAAALSGFDCVFLSDIGANTLLLHPDTFVRSIALPNRLHAIRDYVAGGGGLVMVGGYLTFQGIEAKGQYAGTAIEETLPVTLSRYDDRVECPQGVVPVVGDAAQRSVASAARLQQGHAQAGHDAGGEGRRRPVDRRRAMRQGPKRRLHLGLRSALGTAAFRRLAGLCEIVVADHQMGSRESLSMKVQQPPDPWQRTTTENGFFADEVISALQKSIRRALLENAVLLGWEMYLTSEEMEEKLWSRLAVIAVEDIGLGNASAPVLIETLYQQHQRHPRPGGERFLFAAHAIRVLATSPKDRTSDDLVSWARQSMALGERLPEIPDFALDMHTRRGQEMGRDYRHFLEQASRVEPEIENRDRTWRNWIIDALEKAKLS
jgi:hypothetical protein